MRGACSIFLSAAVVVAVAPAAPAAAQEAEARLLFERGNGHLARGMRLRGRRRAAALQEALDAYLGVLRLGGATRNVIFNLALTLGELGREAEAFDYYSRYLHDYELSAEDRAEGQRRLDALRGHLAVVSIESVPSGAAVRVDRRDLPVRGQTPLDLAVPEGEHTLYLTLDGYEEGTATASAATGQTAQAHVQLTAEAVSVQLIAPGGGTLTLDGEPVEAGRALEVRPGAHVASLALPGAPPIERRFEIQPGSEPLTLDLGAGGAGVPSGIRVDTDLPASVFVDGVGVGSGARVTAPLAPGEHVLRVEAPGRTPASQRITVAPHASLSISVRMGRRADWGAVDAGRVTFTTLGALAAVSGAVFGGLALDLRDQWDAGIAAQQDGAGTLDPEGLNRIADRLEATSLGADISVGAAVLLGGLAIVFFALDPGDGEASHVEVAATPAPGGGALAVSGRIGGS